MCVKAVDDVEVRSKRGSHFGQVGGAASADDKHINLILVTGDVGSAEYLGAFQRGLDRFRRSAGEYSEKLGVGILSDGVFHTSAEVAVAVNRNFHFFHKNHSFII